METQTFVFIAAALLVYGLVSKRAARTVITPPIVFVLFGWLAGPHGLHWIELDLEGEALQLLGELTLTLILFVDAARIDVRELYRQRQIPIRLLLIGLPLTIAAGTLAAKLLFPGFGLFAAAVLATVLTPTDAALGQAVVGNPRLPLRVRQSLNVESGLNDGMVLPALLIFISACAAGHSESPAYWARFAALQVSLGPLAGIAIGFAGAKLLDASARRDWMNATFVGLSSIALSLLAFGVAELVGGNGFIAAFVAGMTFGSVVRESCAALQEFGESEGQFLSLLIFLIFGATMVPEAIESAAAADWIYAGLSLTLLRMIPVGLSLIGLGLRRDTIGFLGWFGPRGLASILFALLVLEEYVAPELPRIGTVVYLTVLLSVLAHGLTAFPLAQALARRLESAAAGAEQKETAPMPTRLPQLDSGTTRR